MTPAPPEIVALRAEAARSFAWRRTDKPGALTDRAYQALAEPARAGWTWRPDPDAVDRLCAAEQAFTASICVVVP